MTKLEEVARALWNAASARAAGRPRLTEWADESEETREQWRHGARAAIEALREPTEWMGAEGLRAWDPDTRGMVSDHLAANPSLWMRPTWQAMIDAIISERE
jgi:hypothetical protein